MQLPDIRYMPIIRSAYTASVDIISLTKSKRKNVQQKFMKDFLPRKKERPVVNSVRTSKMNSTRLA